MIRHNHRLDMVPDGTRTVVRVSQYDEDFQIRLELYAREGDFTVESGTTAAIRGTKPDGNGYSADCTLELVEVTEDEETITVPYVTVTGDQQMTAAAGTGEFEITLYKNEEELNTANFFLSIERAALDKDTVASDSKIREFTEVYDKADEVIEAGAQYARYQAALEQTAQDAADSAAAAANSASTASECVGQLQGDLSDEKAELTQTISEAMSAIEDKKDQIVELVTTSNQIAGQALDKATMAENSAADVSAAVERVQTSIQALQTSSEMHLSGLIVSDGKLYGVNEEGYIITDGVDGVGGGGGGGGGSSATSSISISNTSGFNSKTIADGDDALLSISWSSVESEMPTGNGTLKILVNGVVKAVMDVAQGEVTVNVAPYLTTGANTVRLVITDMYDNSRFTAFNITVASISISSTFDTSIPYEGVISFPYTPVGVIQKTIHFLLDGREIGTETTSVSGRQMSFTIPQQTHGRHSLECYFECTINGQTVESNHLYFEMICLETLNNTPIIVSSYNRTTAVQYETLNIGYSVYDPVRMEAPVTIKVNGTTVAELTVDRTQQVFTYRADTAGSITILITSGTASKSITLTVAASEIVVEAETEALALYLSAQGRSSNEASPWTWTYGSGANAIQATMTGFNGAQNGWMNDNDGNTVLRVMGGARVAIPYKMFESDPRLTGMTFEIEMSTHNVLDYDAEILTCWSGNRGIKMTAQEMVFQAETSSLRAQYKEDDHLRISIVIQKRTEERLVQIYLNGELSRTMQYEELEDFTQPLPVGISIGSDDCGVDIYNIRAYTNNLTRYQILENWIADTQDVGLLLQRYRKNDVFDEYGKIVIEKLPSDLPYMIIECPELPQYKGDKKTAAITYVDPINGNMSFTAEIVQIDVQGTSSQYYAVKNIKAKYKNGLVVNGTSKNGYALREGAIEVDTFTYKADVASSEGANNVILVRLYEQLAKEIGVLTPPQRSNSKIQQGIDGLPMVVFWRNTDTDVTSFVGKYNHNNDKGTPNLFGFSSGDESWEVKDDESPLTKFKSNVFGENWYTEDVEARYPEDNNDNTHLSAMVNWVYSTWQEGATGDALAETYTDVDGNTHTVDNAAYRLAKFKTEFEDHFDLADATFYYLFTLHFLMANSRQKNMFPTYWASTGKWMFLPYDFDTGLGTDNRGTLTYDYNLEDTDSLGNRMVFDGGDVVLWVNFRQAFWSEVQTMYQQLRSGSRFNYEYVEAMFEEHQGKWPTAIFNEDAFYKYINPLLTSGNASYLDMAQGSKTLQRRFWLSNRFDYMDSLMVSGNARTNWINIRPIYSVTEQERAAGAVDLHIIPYAHIYVTVDFDSRRRQIRATRETAVTIENPAAQMSFGNVVAIYSADKIADVGDLSPLKLSYADFSAATRLQRIKVGDASVSYENPNLQTLSVGTNPLMKVIDARNCSALGTGTTSTLDASGCSNIEEIYLEGTALSGVSLPNGGVLKKLHLPETVTSLIIRNQPNLTDLSVPDYSNITTLWLDNIGTVVDEKEILSEIPAGARVRMTGIYWEATNAAEIDGLFDILDTMRGLDQTGLNMDQAQVSGTIHTNALTGAEIAAFNARYPYIQVVADHVTSYLTYKSYDGSSTIKTVTCLDGIPQEAAPSIPSRSSTAQYAYTAVGWNTMQDAQAAEYPAAGPTTGMQADTTLYAAYTATVRTYTVTWKNSNGTTLETDNNVPYGTTPHYDGSTPQNPTSGGGAFQNWTPAIGPVTGNVTYTASYVVTYTVYFYNGSTLLQTVQNVAQGSSATYTGSTPVYNGSGDPNDYTFSEWSPSPTNVQANTSCYAQYSFIGVPETITDTWDQIIANISNGTYRTKYSVGDTKKLDLGTEGFVSMQIVAMDTDTLAAGNGTAPITWISKQLLKTDHRMNPSYSSGTEGTGTLGGWEKCEMRSYLKNTIKPLIPSNVRSAIKEVTKYTRIYTASPENAVNNVATTEDVWIPSRHEMFDGTSQYNETQGPRYSDAFPDNASRIKSKVGASSAGWWWLRSANNIFSFVCVGSDGSNSNGNANYSSGVVLGFCI